MNKKIYISLFVVGVFAVFIYVKFSANTIPYVKKVFQPKKANTIDEQEKAIIVKKSAESEVLEPESLEEKNRRLVVEKNIRLRIGDEGPGEILLSKSEREYARKVVNDGFVENTLMLTPFDDMTSQKFEVLLENFSNEISSQSAIENKNKYLNILHASIDFGAPISLNRIECGDAICIASITYDNEDDIKGFGYLRQFLKKGGYDGKASTIIGKNDIGFTSQNKRALVFTNGDGKGILFRKHKWLK